MVKLNKTPVLFLRTLNRHALRVFVVLVLVALIAPLYTYTRGYLRPAHVEAATGINHQISFQGKLVNPDGTNVTDGSYSIVFSIYTVASAGSNIWTETQSVTLSNGIFQVNLGSVTTLPGSIDFNTDNIYLGIKVGADAEMTPRVQFTAVPQAFNAEKLGGLDKTGFIQNSTSLQSTSNFYIQSNAVGNVTAKLRALGSQTADIIQVRDSGDTTTVFSVAPSGNTTVGGTLAVTGSSTLTGGATIRGLTVDDATATHDLIAVSVGNVGASRFTGTITNGTNDLTAARTWTLPDASGTFAVSASGNIALSTTGNISLTGQVAIGNGGTGASTAQGAINAIDGLTTNGDLLYNDGTNSTRLARGSNGQCLTANTTTILWSSCVSAEADTLASVTARGATTATASSFTGGATIRGLTVDSATGTNDKIALSVTTIGAASFTGTITNADLTVARTWTLPDQDGTVCLSTNNCTGLGAYIQNQNAGQQTASNFWISGSGRADTSILTPTVDVAAAGTLSIGASTATAINIGKTASNVLTTINGTVLVKPTTGNDSTTAFRIQNAGGTNTLFTADTVNSTVKVQSASYATQSANLFTATYSFPATTGWTAISGTGSSATATHTAGGGTTALSPTPAMTVTAGATYQIVFRITGSPTAGQTITPGIGGVNGRPIEGNYSGETQTITATTTGNLTFTPTNNWNGTVSQVFVYQVTTANPAIQVLDRLGNAQLEVRSGAAGGFNSYIGYLSGQNDVNANSNVAVGAYSLQANTFGSSNTAVGYYALNNNNGYYNIGIGDHALYSNTDGLQNIGIGYNSLSSNTTGNDNIGIGYLAQNNLTNGSSNVSLGDNTLGGISNANGNVAIGQSALNTITGSFNTALGYQSGWHDSGGVWSTLATVQNSTAIGAYAQVQASNSIVLGSVDTTTKVGVGITVPTNTFSVSPLDYQTGTATRTNASATLVGTGTTWTSAMVGDIIVFADGTTNTVTGFTDATHVTMGTTYVGTTDASPVRYRFHHIGLQVTSSGDTSVQTLTVIGGTTSTRPASPTEGMIYYDTSTKQLLTYSNGKWQADRTTAKIVAASNSSQAEKDAADFVATGTGDEVTINAALSSLPSNGGTVYLTEGAYNVANQIVIPNNNITLTGPSRSYAAQINRQFTSASNNGVITFDKNNVTVQNLAINGVKATYSATTNHDIYVTSNAAAGTIMNVIAFSAGGNGVFINGGGVQQNNYVITGNYLYQNAGDGLRAFSLWRTSVSGNSFESNSGNGMYVNQGASIIVSNNTAKSNTGAGFTMTAGVSLNGNHALQNSIGFSVTPVGGDTPITLSGNTTYANTTYGIYLTDTFSVSVTTNTLSADTVGIEASGGSFSKYLNITGNTLQDIVQTSIQVATNGIAGVNVSNNVIRNGGGSGAFDAISLGATSVNSSIQNNLITDTAGTGYAISIASGATGTYLSNNTYSGTGATSINDAGTGTVYANQADASGNFINKSQGGGFTVGASAATATLTLQGGAKINGLPNPTLSATVTNVGTAGATTYRYQVTALDGVGETTGSTIQQTTTGNATLSGTNYNTITWTPVGGAFQYRIYRCTGAACTPALLTVVAGNTSSYNDQAPGAPSGAVPTTNTTGGVQVASSLMLGTPGSVNGSLIVTNATNANTITLVSGATSAPYSLTLPTTGPTVSKCLQTDSVTASLLVFGSCGAGISTVGTFSGSSQVNGATISGSTITFGPADTTNPGMVTASGTQTFGGAKTFNGSVTVAAAQTLRIVGDITTNRATDIPSPTEGMLFYDTTTKQLLVYANGKWQADRSPETKIIAPSNASQTAKDSADVVLTGTADQTLINTALTAAAGGSVYILEGQVNVTGSISVPNNTKLSGAGRGTLITIPNSTNIAFNMITNTTTGGSGTGVVIQDLQLDGNRPNNLTAVTYGVYLNGMGSGTGGSAVQGAKVTNMWINRFHGGAVYLTSSSNNTITNNITKDNFDRGFNITSGSNNVIANNISQVTPYGFYLDTATNNTLSGNNAQGSVNDGFRLTTNSNGNTITGNTADSSSANNFIVSSTSIYNTFTGNTSRNSATDGFAVFADNNTFTGNTSYNSSSAEFDVGASYNTFTGNTLKGTSTSFYGFQLNAANNNTISSNTITDAGSSFQNNAIYLSNSDSNNITSNSITDTTHTSSNVAIYIVDSACDTNYLASNTLGGGTLSDLGTGTIYGGQLDTSGNYTVQPAGTIELQANTQVKPTIASATAFQVLNTAGNSPITVSTAADSQNLITNPGFEINTTGWALKGAATIARSTAQHYFGQASLAITTTAVANDGAKFPLVLAANTQYSYYFDIYSASPVSGVSFGYSADGSTEATYVSTSNISAGWNHVFMNFTTPASVNAGAYFFAKQTDATARTFYIDDVEADTKSFGVSTNVVSGGYVENVISIGGANSVATSLGINTTSPVGALEVDQKFGQMGVVIKASGENTGLSQPYTFSIWNADNTTAVSYSESTLSTTIKGGNSFWNTAALQVTSTATAGTALRVTGASGQTADLLQVRDSNNKGVFSVGAAGDTQIGKGTILPTVTKSVKSSSSGTFAAKADSNTGAGARGMTSADFNGDGYPDMAVTNNGTTTVSVFLNNGNGTFPSSASSTLTAGANPRDVAAADFNGDGYPDIAVTNNSGTTVSVFFNNGNGTFTLNSSPSVGTTPNGIAAADFNGDGKADLAVANSGSATVSVLINNGNGTFAAKVDYTTGTTPLGIAAADFNGDGKADLAVANSGSTTVSIFINSGLGAGQFGASPPAATTKVDYTTGTTPRDLAAADFNGDGKYDLAVTNNGTNTISVFINSGLGAGQFGASPPAATNKVDYTTGTNPYDITTADFNGDGYSDLANANNNGGTGTTMSVLLGSSSGTFTLSSSPTTGTNPQGITSADFNHDGYPDVAVSNNTSNTVSVFINTVSSGFSSSTTTQLSAKTSILSDSGKVGLLVQGASTSDNIFQAQNSSGQLLSTIDGMGRLTVGGGPVYVAQLSVDGHVSFATKVDYTPGTNPRGITAADFNGDGKPDIAVANNSTTTMSVLMNNGNGTFATKVDYTSAGSPYGITAADYNGDGKPDIAVTNGGSTNMSVFINNGDGTFATKVDYTTGTNPRNITSADFNGDGKNDLVITNSGSNTVSVFINNGTGTFAAKVDYTTGSSPLGVTSADYNGDGKPDIAVANGTTTVSVLINNGTGTFAAKVDYTTAGASSGVTSADYNGDGKPDIAVTNGGSTTSVFINNGNGTFATKVDYTAGTNPTGVTSADYNGDGKPDIAVANGGGTMSIFINTGTGTFATKIDYTAGTTPTEITTADYNGDGKPDIAVANFVSTTISVFMNTATLQISPSSKGTLSVTTADGASGGLYIQGVANQTADLLNIQNSSGSELFSVDATGLTTTKQLVIRSDVVSTTWPYPSRTLVVDNAVGSTQNVISFAVGGVERATLRADNSGNVVLNGSGAGGGLFLNYDAGTNGVTIGNVTNKNNLTVNGTAATCTLGGGTGATNCTSDGRLKNIIGEATGNLDKLMQIQPTYFTWKDPTMDQGVKLGLIAQDVQAQFPQFVITDANGNLALDYAALVTPLIGAVQEQQTEIQALGTSVTTANLNVSGAATVASLTVTGDATVQGKLVVEGDVEVRNITVNGHIITSGNAPVVAAGDALGQATANEAAPVAIVDGNDSAGTVSVTTGSQNLANGVLAHISFAEAFGGSYKVVLSASNDPAGLLRVHTVKTATGFDIVANDPASALTQYDFDYIVLGSQTTQ